MIMHSFITFLEICLVSSHELSDIREAFYLLLKLKDICGFFVYGQVDLIDEALLNEWQQQKTLLNYRFFYNAFKDS